MSTSINRWSFNLNAPRPSELTFNLAEPVGYNKTIVAETTSNSKAVSKDADKDMKLKKKRAMQIAVAPGKNLFMQGFMMWMSGSSVQIFSIMITAMAIFNSFKAILSVNAAFVSVDDGKVNMLQPKAVYILVNLVGLAMAVYKCGTMGLLPTTSADWSWLLPMKEIVETSQVVYSL